MITFGQDSDTTFFSGEIETLDDISFKDRRKKPPYTDILDSKINPIEDYQWSEIKSSLLVNELYSNTDTHDQLLTFIQNIFNRLCIILKLVKDEELTLYLKEFNNKVPNTNSYPVAQQLQFTTIEEIWEDFYALYNVIKWMWGRIRSNTYNIIDNNNCENPFMLFFIIDLFQQQTLVFHMLAKGYYREDNVVPNDHIGISNIQIPELVRKIRNKPSYNAVPWDHPGQGCKIPYHGQYGSHMKNYRQDPNNNKYSSLQCNISGSTQYILYMYLLSISTDVESKEPSEKDIRDLISSSVLILTGDGGHNIREVMFGLVLTIILLYHFIKEIKRELTTLYSTGTFLEKINNYNIGVESFSNKRQPLLTSIYNRIGYTLMNIRIPEKPPISPFNCTNHIYNNISGGIHKNQMFKVLNTLKNVRPIIHSFYKKTQDFNILGVAEIDLSPNILSNLDNIYKKIKTALYKHYTDLLNKFQSPLINTPLIEKYSMVQLFFTLEKKRFKHDINNSFKEKPDKFIQEIIKSFNQGQQVLDTVNSTLKNIFDRGFYTGSESIPFAFSNRSTK
jgi:hypothetical protein